MGATGDLGKSLSSLQIQTDSCTAWQKQMETVVTLTVLVKYLPWLWPHGITGIDQYSTALNVSLLNKLTAPESLLHAIAAWIRFSVYWLSRLVNYYFFIIIQPPQLTANRDTPYRNRYYHICLFSLTTTYIAVLSSNRNTTVRYFASNIYFNTYILNVFTK